MNFIDLFSGIGGFRLGMEAAGHTCVGHVEIDKFANQSYQSIHQPGEGEVFYEDITRITDESIERLRTRNIGVICGGFPCQAFSIAGKRLGFEDTRGTLFFHIARMARILRPKYLFLENVKGLLNHNNGNTFETIIRTLDELGYDAEWQVLNSKNFGVPQNRERVFIIGHLRGTSTKQVFPIGEANGKNNLELEDGKVAIWEGTRRRVGQEIYNGKGIFLCLTTKSHFSDIPKIAIKEATSKGYSEATIGDSINLEQPKSETRRGRVGKGVAQTLTCACNQGVVIDEPLGTVYCEASKKFGNGFMKDISKTIKAHKHDIGVVYGNYKIRKLTPRECWRLQGFPDWAFDRAKESGVSDSQLYKQAGNSVTVNVIEAIARKLK